MELPDLEEMTTDELLVLEGKMNADIAHLSSQRDAVRGVRLYRNVVMMRKDAEKAIRDGMIKLIGEIAFEVSSGIFDGSDPEIQEAAKKILDMRSNFHKLGRDVQTTIVREQVSILVENPR